MSEERKNWYNGTLMTDAVISHMSTRKDSSFAGKWKAEKRPWMRLISNSTQGSWKGMTIDGGADFWNRSGLYEEDSGRIAARPTLEEISIQSTGTAGTMRKANIKFRVYSYKQLADVQMSFFIPGMSVFAYWGWTITQDETPVNTNPGTDGLTSLSDITATIKEWSNSQQGCADGICGVVSNFEWSKAQGGGADMKGFDCEITVESPAKSFLEQSVNPSNQKNCGCTEGSEDNDDKDDKVKGGWVKQAIKDQAKSEMDNLGSGQVWKNNSGEILGVSFSFDSGHQPDPDDKWYEKLWDSFTALVGSTQTNHYVTWDWFETTCVTSGLSVAGENYKASNLAEFTEGIQSDERFADRIWRLNSAGVKLAKPSDPTKFCSTNPFVCIIPGHFHWDVAGKGDTFDSATMLMFADVSNAEGIKSLPPWDGDIGKIFINCNYIWAAYNESDTLHDFIMKVANGVNEACGNWWNLQICEDPYDSSRLVIKDLKAVETQAEAPVLDMGSTTPIARNWGMSTDVPAALKHSIILGANGKPDVPLPTDDPTKVWRIYGREIQDSVLGGLEQSVKCEPDEMAKERDCPKGSEMEGGKKKISDFEDDLVAACSDLLDNVTDETTSSAASAMKAYWQFRQEEARENSQIAIPISFDCTLDGYGSFAWGMGFSVRQINESGILPDGYRFIITGIKQKVNRLDWTVDLETRLVMPAEGGVVDLETGKRAEAEAIAKAEPNPTNVQVYDDSPVEIVENENAEDPELTFKIPTSQGWNVRKDTGGDGRWNAPRGGRQHKGIDLKSSVGDQLVSPIDGKVKLTAAVAGGMPGTKIEGTGDYAGYTAYLFYAAPNSGMVGKRVSKGETVATQGDLSVDYPENVTDHVHVAIKKGGEHLDPSLGDGDINWEA